MENPLDTDGIAVVLTTKGFSKSQETKQKNIHLIKMDQIKLCEPVLATTCLLYVVLFIKTLNKLKT